MPKDQNKESWEEFERWLNILTPESADLFITDGDSRGIKQRLRDCLKQALANELERVMGSLPEEKQSTGFGVIESDMMKFGFNDCLSTVKDIISKRVEEIRG